MSRSTPNDAKALARFVLTPTKPTNGRSLDQQWGDLASFLRGPASALARWLAVAQMHSVYRQMRAKKSLDERRDQNLLVRTFVERACEETGLSRPTIYNYVDRSRSLVEVLGPALLKEMLSGRQRIANDENILIKLAQLPAAKAQKVVEVYMHGRGEAAAARLAEKSLHGHRLAALTHARETRVRGGVLVDAPQLDRATNVVSDPRNVVLFGDALLHMRESIPPESVQTCITSPPFYGQRDFGTRHWFGGEASCKHDTRVAHRPFHDGFASSEFRTARASADGQTAVTHSCSKCGAWRGQLGQEPDIGMFLDHIVEVFREVRRVLRPDGVCWVEIGDSYNAGTARESRPTTSAKNGVWTRTQDRLRARSTSLPVKSLLLIPQRLTIALQEDGWVVRAEVIFHKLTALPESVTDRPTRAHSTILMLTKSANYFYDATAVLEPVTGGAVASGFRRGPKEARPGSGNKANRSFHAATGDLVQSRNCRDVWSFVSGRFPDAHTATFPPALPERCIRASTSEYGACARCGAPWLRRTHQVRVGGNVRRDGSVAPYENRTPAKKYLVQRMRAGRLGKRTLVLPEKETIGWEPTCECGVADVKSCIVLDPFAGSGTTLMVAKQLGRDYVGIELNEVEYRPLIEKRLAGAERVQEHTRARRAAARRS